MSLVSSAQIEGIRRKNEFSCFCQLVTLLSPLLRAGMCWPLFPLHHGSVGSFWEVVAGFINSASCLLGQACSQLFFFPVFFLAFCGRLVRRSFLGAPPPPSETASLCCQHGKSGVRQGEWDYGESVLWPCFPSWVILWQFWGLWK